MALKFGSDKRKGNKGRTTINPQIGGKAGDAGPKFQREGAQPRTKITNSRISDSPDAGFSGSKKSIAPGSFKAAFAVAFAKKPGGTFTYKGKKYLASRKGQGKGPSASRVEDKVSKATIIKGKRDTTKSKKAQLDNAAAGVKLVDKVLSKKKAPTPASGRFGQRKAGGIMKAKDGDIVGSTAVYTQARKQAGEDRVTMQDLKEAAKNLGYKVTKDTKDTRNPAGKRTGGIMKANTGKMANKDYDGDGRIESSTAEYMGSRDKAIKSKKLRGGGAAIRGNNFKGIS